MNRKTIIAATILAAASSAAFAQSNSATPKAADQTNLRQQVLANLQQAGFTDVKVMPELFLIQARDKSGNPVTMFISPNSFAEMSTTAGSNQRTTGANQKMSANDANTRPGGAFTAVPAKDGLSTKVVGLEVHNNANQSIGTIKDIAFNDNGIDGYILSVGGFLGIGDHYVAVRPSSIDLTYDRTNNRWRATMDANAQQLKAAPEFKYPSNT